MRARILIKFFLTLLISCGPKSQYVIFEPVVSGERGFVRDSTVETDFNKNLEVVLQYYGIDYKKSKREILINESYYMQNLELMMNLTLKARDPKWLAEHQ